MAPDPSFAHQPLHRTMPLCPKNCHLLKKQSRNVQLWKMMSQTHQNFQSYKCYDISFFSLCEKQPLMWKQIYSWNILKPTKLGTRFHLKYLDVEKMRGKVPKSLMPQLSLTLGHSGTVLHPRHTPTNMTKKTSIILLDFTRLDFSILLLIALHPKRL